MDEDKITEIVNAIIAADRARHAAMLAAPQGTVAASLNLVGVKLPEFQTSDQVIMFKQAETMLRQSNMTASFTQYHHVLVKLLEVVVISLCNLIDSVQPKDSGSSIKHPNLGDRWLLQMMNEMLALLPSGNTGKEPSS